MIATVSSTATRCTFRVDTEWFGYLPADSAQAIGPELDSGREVRAHVAKFVGSPEPNAMRIRITSAGG